MMNNNSFKLSMKNTILVLLCFLIAVYFSSSYLYDSKWIVCIKPIIIPLFVCYAYIENKRIFSYKYILFVLFFYCSETLMVFSVTHEILVRYSLVFSFFTYLSLINIVFEVVKNSNFQKIIKGYNLFVVLLNAFFLVLVVLILISTLDKYTNYVVVLNAFSAILLAITAIIYLSALNSKKSIIYFFGAFAIILSDIFAALVFYYLEDEILNLADRILHFVGFFMIYLFVLENKKVNESMDYTEV